MNTPFIPESNGSYYDLWFLQFYLVFSECFGIYYLFAFLFTVVISFDKNHITHLKRAED